MTEPPDPPHVVDRRPSRRFARLAILFEGSLILFALGLGWLVGYPPTRHLPPSDDAANWARGLAWGMAGSLPLLAMLWLMVRFPLKPWAGLFRFVSQEVLPLFRGLTVSHFLLISILAGCGEEMLFRGVAQDLLVGWFGLTVGILLTSCLFGLCHWLTITYAIIAALIGLYLSWLNGTCGGNLIVPMTAHSAYDFGAIILLLRRGAAPGTPQTAEIA